MTTWARHVLSMKNSVQVNNYNIYRARKLDHWLNFTVTRHKAMMTQGNLCVNENQIRADETETGAKNNSSASGADLRADVIGGYVVSHRSIGLVTSVFFATVCTVVVTGMRK